MNYLLSIIIGLSLAADCFVVSTILAKRKLKSSSYFIIPFHFGFFQFAMALLGYFIGSKFISLIDSFDHWIAFILLSIIGVKMIKEFFEEEKLVQAASEFELISLSVATSIDALVVGLALGSQANDILTSTLIIGIVTFIVSWFGLKLGKKLEKFKYFEIIGGLILIGLGIKVLIEHLF